MLQYTDEQLNCINSTAHNLSIIARAGSGKTSTLIGYALKRPEKRIVYVAFNRAIKEEAAKKFPKNVRCVTTHGLAYPGFGKHYAHKFGNPRPYQISSALNISFIMAGYAIDAITSFLCSMDIQIGAQHVPDKVRADANRVIAVANSIWAMMQDTTNRSVPMPHDGYLKLYQLSKPTINADIILFDEAQDANPVTLSIFVSQECGKVLVGDPYQAIYGFRHAVDALSSFKPDETQYLTQSFRFGPGVAKLASSLLAHWKGDDKPIIGRGKHATEFHVDLSKPHAEIARTNAGLFDASVGAYRANVPYAFVGGVDGYKFDSVLNVYRLYAQQTYAITDKFIASFASFEQMKEYAETVDDAEIKSLVKVVENYTHSIPALVDGIKMYAIPVPTGNEVLFMTAHKSKGLEFDSVVMIDDYPSLEVEIDPKTGKFVPPEPEEINLLYVVLTRAQRCLKICSSLHDWLAEQSQLSLLANKS